MKLENNKERFHFSYESSATASYLVLQASIGERIQQYQVEMLANNPVAGILPLNLRQKDDKLYLYYNITSKMPLPQYLSRKKLARNEFIDILGCITSLFLECKSYLLSDECFLLDEEYIYINPGTAEISMVYLPVAVHSNMITDVKEFIIKFAVYSANIDENTNDNFLQKILAFVKADTFSIAEFDKLLRNLRISSTLWGEKVDPIAAAPQVDSGPLAKKAEEGQFQFTSVTVDGRANMQKIKMPGRSGDKIPPDGISAKFPQEKEVRNSANRILPSESDAKKQYKYGTILIAVLSQIAAAVALILGSEFLRSVSGDIASAYAGSGIVVLAVDFLLFQKLFHKKNLTAKPLSSQHVKQFPASQPVVDMAKREVRSIPNIQLKTGNAAVDQKENRQLPYVPHRPSQEEAAVLFCNHAGETTFLEPQRKRLPFLQGSRDGILEEVPVSKACFIIGRLREQVDYVSQNSAVGKVHAEIICRNGNYFIKDLNSRNGTFINQVRIDSNKEYEIRNNDKVTFANSEYTFIVPGA